MYMKKGRDGEGLRLGITVPKKAVALATRRNYIKRVIRAYFRTNRRLRDNNCAVVFRMGKVLVRQQKKALAEAIRQDMEDLTGKAGLQ